LSLSEVARRLGIKPPSLYKYFPSRLALYDRLFADASSAISRSSGAVRPGRSRTAGSDRGGGGGRAMGDGQQALTQLLFWRPIPGFEPSAEAFAPSVAMLDEVRRMLADAARLGQLGPGAAAEEGVALFSILVAGMFSQQLANGPHESFADGRFTRLAPQIFAMFRQHYRQRRDPMTAVTHIEPLNRRRAVDTLAAELPRSPTSSRRWRPRTGTNRPTAPAGRSRTWSRTSPVSSKSWLAWARSSRRLRVAKRRYPERIALDGHNQVQIDELSTRSPPT
jgi:AcrR family transcriptional regulator